MLTGSKTLAWAGVRRAGVSRAKAAARRTASAPGREAHNRAGRRETANSETPSGVPRDSVALEPNDSNVPLNGTNAGARKPTAGERKAGVEGKGEARRVACGGRRN